jgi:hypothetical protein
VKSCTDVLGVMISLQSRVGDDCVQPLLLLSFIAAWGSSRKPEDIVGKYVRQVRYQIAHSLQKTIFCALDVT